MTSDYDVDELPAASLALTVGPYWWQPQYAFADNAEGIAEVHAFKRVTRLRVVAMQSLLSHPSALSYNF